MKKYDVIVVGELNADLILNQIEGFPKVGTEILAQDMQLVLGSSSAIFACNLSTIGAKVAFLGMLGKDVLGDMVVDTLRKKNVSTEFLIQDPNRKTGVTIALNYDEERAMITHPGAMNYLELDDIKDVVLSQARHLHISSVFLQPLIRKDIVPILTKAKSLGLTTSLDPQWDPSENWNLDLSRILPYVDVFLPNRKEFLLQTNSETINEGLRKVGVQSNTIVIKDGESGAHLWKNKKLTSMQAFQNNHVIDCIGAGDSFDAGFVSQFIRNKDLEDCLEYGNLCGAINTTSAGGTGAFDSFEYVQKIALEIFDYKLDDES